MLPTFHEIAIDKKSIADLSNFMELVELYNLKVVYNEPLYYILDGAEDDLHDFQQFWRA